MLQVGIHQDHDLAGAISSLLVNLGVLVELKTGRAPATKAETVTSTTPARVGLPLAAFPKDVLSIWTRYDFRSGALDIVVGTQMVAKGHDLPGVRLVGVIVADLGLHMPDFRAAERTFQLLSQVAGRAGRGPKGGDVVIQTRVPGHHAVRHAAALVL